MMSSSGRIIASAFSRGGGGRSGGLTRRIIRSSTRIVDKHLIIPVKISSSKTFRIHHRLKSSAAESGKETKSGFEDLDKPIKFTTSKAAEWRATDTHGGGADDDSIPSIQPFAVTISVAIFLLYFLALREENDVDERMKIPLWERIPGLERQQLEMLLQYNKERGLPTEDISERLALLNRQRAEREKAK